MSKTKQVQLDLECIVEFFPTPEEDFVGKAIYKGPIGDTGRLRFIARDRRDAKRVLDLHLNKSQIKIEQDEGEHPIVSYQDSLYSEEHDIIEINAGSDERRYLKYDKELKGRNL